MTNAFMYHGGSENGRLVTTTPYLFGVVKERINRFILQELKRRNILGLVPSHISILNYLFAVNHVTMKQLATVMGRDKSTITVHVSKLIKMGYANKVPSDEDQRLLLVVLTSKGRELQGVFNDISVMMNARLYNGVDMEEQEDIRRIVSKIMNNLR